MFSPFRREQVYWFICVQYMYGTESLITKNVLKKSILFMCITTQHIHL